MRHLDLTDVVALAAEVSEVEVPKLLKLLDTSEINGLLAQAQRLLPHQASALLMAGVLDSGPLPAGNRRLAVLAALHLLTINGLDASLDPQATRDLLTAGADVAMLVEWLDQRVTARDPLDGALRDQLSPDAWRAITLAVQRARRHRRLLASPEDLLTGVFREGTGPAAVAMGADDGGVAVVTPAALPEDRPAFSPETRKAFELAMRAATSLAQPHIDTGHLLLGLLDSGYLVALPDDVSPVELRRQVLERIGCAGPLKSDVTQRTDERLLADYVADIARYPVLSRDEEIQLAHCIRSAPKQESAMCQRRLIQANLALVVKIARKYQPVGVPLLDLIQEGNLGLMRAVERYDPAKGYRFATFATWWIRHRIQRAVGRAQT